MRRWMLPIALASLSMFGCAETVSQPSLTSGSTEPWDGVYSATWTGPPVIPGDTAPRVGYTLRVTSTPAGVAVEIAADGTHTFTRMRGDGRVNGLTLGVHFAGCGPDDMYKCSGFAKGDLLLSLRRTSGPVSMEFGGLRAPDLKTTDLTMSMAAPPSTVAAIALHAPAQ